jgi:hypothetical protein
MRFLANPARLSRPLACLALSAGLTGLLAPAALAASADTSASMPGMDGWIRLAHLSPSTPPVDVYLYSFSNPHARLVLHHVAYGTVESYTRVMPGEYTVAMRKAGSAAGSPPVLSATVRVRADRAYTVASLGHPRRVKLQVLQDRIMAPRHKILVRVIQASLHQHRVTVTAGHVVLASNLAFGDLSRYRVADPGTRTFRATGGSEHASRDIRLVPDCIHTIVVLDARHSLKIDDLLDTAGAMKMPMGGVDTGLGGTAAGHGSPAEWWLAAVGAGSLLALAGTVTIRRVRHRPLHAR